MNRNPHFHDALESVCYWGYGGGFLSYSKGKYKEEGGGFTEGETVMA